MPDIIFEAEQATEQIENISRKYEFEVEDILANDRLTVLGKNAEIEELTKKVNEEVVAARGDIHERIDRELDDLDAQETALRRQVSFEPQDLAGWQEANARAVFVRENIERMARRNKEDIVAAFLEAVEEEDLILQYLIAHYGLEALYRVAEEQNDPRVYRQLRDAITKVEDERIDSKALGRIKQRRSRLLGTRARLLQVRTPEEIRQLKARFKI